jgi:hypothetical protein
LALVVTVSVPVVGTTTVASARAAVHRNDTNDSTWIASEAPIPADAWSQDDRVWVTATACPAAGSCFAVGYYNTQHGSNGLIETIADGTSSLIEAPMPPGGHDGDLTGITCSSIDFCVATGTFGNDEGMIDTLADGSWTGTKAPLPADVPNGNVGVTLGAVSCPADGSCVIVGSAGFDGPDSGLEAIPFIDTLSDGKWTSTDAPLPANAIADYEFNGPTAVSCAAVGSCVAVGTYYDESTDISGVIDSAGLIDTLSGGSWTAQTAPVPPTTDTDQIDGLGSVACPAVGSCEAIGGISSTNGAGTTTEDGVIETLAGGSWTVMAAPIPAGSPSDIGQLGELACPAVGWCVIVGDVSDGPGQPASSLEEDLSGGTWTATSPSGLIANTPQSFVCPAVESCVSVSGDGIATLSDGVWTDTVAPVPANAGAAPYPGDPQDWAEVALFSVSCATITSCAASGQYTIPSSWNPNGTDEALLETIGLGGPYAPAISSPDQATFTLGTSNSFTVTASGAPALAFSEKGKLPKGVHFTKGPGTATIEGTPTKKTGKYSLTITATSASTNERVSQPFALTVAS